MKFKVWLENTDIKPGAAVYLYKPKNRFKLIKTDFPNHRVLVQNIVNEKPSYKPFWLKYEPSKMTIDNGVLIDGENWGPYRVIEINGDKATVAKNWKMFNFPVGELRFVHDDFYGREGRNLPAGKIYVLELENGKWYVGWTGRKDSQERINMHFNGEGSKWTRLHKPVAVHTVLDGTVQDEGRVTLEFMRKYGWENVRGGDWVACDMGVCPKELNQESI